MPPPRSPIKGDHSKRVVVPLPQTLNDLETSAKTHFPGPGRCRMYHRGETQLETQQQFKNVVDHDVVIIRKESLDTGVAFPRNMQTTNQSSFVKHPLEPRRPAEAPRQPQSDMNPPKFHGRSCYAGDYVEHPLSSPDRPKAVTPAWEGSTIPMTSRSTYTENYPWHPAQPKRSERPSAEKGKSYTSSPPPFHGTSSYKIDYIKHQPQRPKSASGPRRRDRERQEVGGDVPFNGTTTYTTDYKKHAHAQSKPITNGSLRADPGPSPPFQGNSEYRNEYVQKERPRRPLIYLEPERRRSSGGRSSPE